MDTVQPQPTCVEEKDLVVELDVFNNIRNKKLEQNKNERSSLLFYFQQK